MRKRPRNNSAFTLLELILVMVIIAIIVAAIVPSFTQLAAGRNNSNTASLVVSLATYAHTQAITQGCVYRLNFDPQSRAVWLTVQSQLGATFAAPTGAMGQRFTAADGVQFNLKLPQHDDGQYVEFYPSGRNESGQMWFSNSYGNSYEVACASATESFRVLPAKEMTQQ
jgi:prepilin-type N-terminal cleavage/methylation domain-containing protein